MGDFILYTRGIMYILLDIRDCYNQFIRQCGGTPTQLNVMFKISRFDALFFLYGNNITFEKLGDQVWPLYGHHVTVYKIRPSCNSIIIFLMNELLWRINCSLVKSERIVDIIGNVQVRWVRNCTICHFPQLSAQFGIYRKFSHILTFSA